MNLLNAFSVPLYTPLTEDERRSACDLATAIVQHRTALGALEGAVGALKACEVQSELQAVALEQMATYAAITAEEFRVRCAALTEGIHRFTEWSTRKCGEEVTPSKEAVQ